VESDYIIPLPLKRVAVAFFEFDVSEGRAGITFLAIGFGSVERGAGAGGVVFQ